MNTRFLGLLDRFPGTLNICSIGTRKSRNGGLTNLTGNCSHGFEVSLRRYREPGFDDVHVEPLELTGHFQLFFKIHRAAWGLFPITEGGIENIDFVRHVVSSTGRARLAPIIKNA